MTIAVHPRASGEHSHSPTSCPCNCGSSPRERGTLRGLVVEAHGCRFIPARAGNTHRASGQASHGSVHPRASGEHAHAARHAEHVAGSSPRERGTLLHRAPHPLEHRFIPARAGNTYSALRKSRSATVHPRASGEHVHVGFSPARRDGSSPRERGTRACNRARRQRHRFIPARAGNTSRKDSDRRIQAVHPRASGEHAKVVSRSATVNGSSPRERGTPSESTSPAPAGRFIPARAGNTMVTTLW